MLRERGWALAFALIVVACSADESAENAIPVRSAGQFEVECGLSHAAFDDPLVLPWQPGKSHLHLFFGNRAVTSDPGYDDRLLRADTSCAEDGETGSYWAPALLDASGRAIEPLGLTAVHRVGNGVDPAEVVGFPEGLMLIGGEQTATIDQSTEIVWWSCDGDDRRSAAPELCGPESTLRLNVMFPDCWDGVRLTTFGASAHARYSSTDHAGGCPESHPVAVPQLTIGIDYPPVDPADLSLSSGAITTAHADFWNVWDQAALVASVEDCINADIACV